jgi:predicted NAD/FAD-binding protein
MLSDVLRFYKEAESLMNRADLMGVTLGDYLERERYSKAFIEDHLMPMGAAIWSMTTADMRGYPLHAFVRFFVHHGLILISGRPRWRTVTGGSREYVAKLQAAICGEFRRNTPVKKIERTGAGVVVTDTRGNTDTFDDVIIATHANDALSMLTDANEAERDVLGAFRYTDNTAVLHSDAGLMPRRKSVWSSWNYIGGRKVGDQTPLCVTYWMNRLQNLPEKHPLFVTLNPCRDIREETVIGTFNYTHPLFDQRAMEAQRRIWDIQGQRNTWFCGAHFGSGFHEDGLQAGLAVAEAVADVRRPWRVMNESGRIFASELAVAAE